MKNVLIASGWVLVYLLVFIMSTFYVALGFSMAYILLSLLGIALPEPVEYLAESITLILLGASILSVVFYYLIFKIQGLSLVKYVQIKRLPGKLILASLLAGLGISLFLNGFLGLLRFDQLFAGDVGGMAQFNLGGSFILLLVTVGIVVPFFEELLFRGLILRTLKGAMPLSLAIVIQALLFGIAHGNWYQFIYTTPMGVLLAVIYLQTGSLWAPILVHMLANITSSFIGILMPVTATETGLLALTILGIVITLIGIKLFRHQPHPRSDPSPHVY